LKENAFDSNRHIARPPAIGACHAVMTWWSWNDVVSW